MRSSAMKNRPPCSSLGVANTSQSYARLVGAATWQHGLRRVCFCENKEEEGCALLTAEAHMISNAHDIGMLRRNPRPVYMKTCRDIFGAGSAVARSFSLSRILAVFV